MKLKSRYRAVVAIALVVAVTISLWFAAPVLAFTIDIDNPASGTLGTDYSFTVDVNIEDTGLLPIQSVDLEIYNTGDPTKKAICTDLPLTTATHIYTSAQTGGGAVSVEATADPSWGYGYGYGYAQWEGYGYYFFPPGGYGYGYGGYGYGYGYGYAPTSITYEVTWTPPSASNWAGTYRIDVEIVANGTTFTKTSSAFTLSAPPAPPGPPGPPPPALATDTDLFGIEGEFPISDEGVIEETLEGTSEDGNLTVTLPVGTTALDEDGNPLTTLEVTVDDDPPPPPPEDTSIIGLLYNFGPEGATFDPALILTWSYDEGELPEGVNEEDLSIAFYDEEAGEWVVIDCVVDTATNTITGYVTGFTTFAILTPTAPPVFTFSALTIIPTEVDIGQTVTISTVVTNTGDLTGSYVVTIKINGVVEDTSEVTLIGSESQTVVFTTVQTIPGDYTVNVEGQIGTFTVEAPPAPAEFVLSNLTISPAEVKLGESVNISATISNTGEVEGSYIVTLKLNDVAEDTKVVTLAGGQSTTVAFTVSPDVTGIYNVEVDGLVGSFSVVEIVKPINWWLIGSIIAASIIIIGVVIWLAIRLRRRRLA